MARALVIPIYQLFYDSEKRPVVELPENADDGWGSCGRDPRTLGRFRKRLQRISKVDQKLLMFMAQRMSQRKCPRSKSRA